MKTLIRLFALAAATLLALPAAAQIQPAGYTEGFVRSINVQLRTLTVGVETYAVRGTSAALLAEIQPGDAVELTYIVERGQWIALDVRKTGERAGLQLFNFTR